MLSDLVFLTQTDTTIGFVSQNAERLTHIKERPATKHYIKAVDSLATLTQHTRVPAMHKNRVRRSCKTTFVMPNGHSYRVTYDSHHLLLLHRIKWAYTTSANRSGQNYDEDFAKTVADIIIAPLHKTRQPSTIYKLGHNTIKRIR